MYGNFNNKKLANLFFNITFKKYDFNNYNFTYPDSTFSEYNNLNNLNNMSKIEKFSTFREESALPFIYYNIKNQTILLNGSNKNLNDGIRFPKNNFFSINDIEELEISGELKSERLPIDRLIELLGISKKKFELYEILKKINYYILKKDLPLENMLTIMQKIILRIDEIKMNRELHDEVLSPYIYFVLRNILIKFKKSMENIINRESFNAEDIMNNNNPNNFNVNPADLNKGNILFQQKSLESTEAFDFSNKNINTYKNDESKNQVSNINPNANDPLSYKKSLISSNENKNIYDNIDDLGKEYSQNYNQLDYDNSNHRGIFLKNKYDFKLFKDIILKSFFSSIENIEYHPCNNKHMKNIINYDILNYEKYKQSLANYDSFFNLNRKKIISSVSYIAEIFEDFFLFNIDNSNNLISIKIHFKTIECVDNKKNVSSSKSGKEITEKLKGVEISQNKFCEYTNNLYFLLDHSANFYDNADLVFNILSINIKILKSKDLLVSNNSRIFEYLITDEIFLNISKNFKNNCSIMTNLYHLTSLYWNYMSANFPEKINVITIFNICNILYNLDQLV